MMSDVSANPERPDDRRRGKPAGRDFWRWFVTGFAIVFIGMSLAVTMHSMLPSGQAVIECPLWRYYLIEMRRALTSSGVLGPATGSTSAAIMTMFGHVVFSLVGGLAMAGVGWAIRRIKASRRSAI